MSFDSSTIVSAQSTSSVTLRQRTNGIAVELGYGTWSWSLNTADGPAAPFTVTITATDDQNAAANATFMFAINNVLPTISLSGNATVNEGSEYTLNLGAVTDPGHDTISSYAINWGDGAIDSFTGNPANAIATHTYDDGPTTLTHTVTVTDDDSLNILAGSLSVIVKNVAPTATFANNGPITYGQTLTVSFSNQHDDSSADSAAGFRYAYSKSGDFTGITYTNGSSAIAAYDYSGLDAGSYTFRRWHQLQRFDHRVVSPATSRR